MRRTLTISETGLKLIKAFEGYRPVDRETVTGQRVVGYGHRLYSDEAVRVSKAEAEDLLRADLQPFEDMISDEVHAPLSQSQFDALCSFAFSIGPRAFLQSDTLRALNNGRVLDAANGIDIWRKSRIDGKTYVVDALVRRRTAEKALFLKLGQGENLTADRVALESEPDETLGLISTEDALPVFSKDEANGIVATAPYDAKTPEFGRRREDGPSGILELSELALDDVPDDIEDIPAEASPEQLPRLSVVDADASDEALETTLDPEVEDAPRQSPIAAAATDIVERLEALIEEAGPAEDESDLDDWPESLITPSPELERSKIETAPADRTVVAPPETSTFPTASLAETAQNSTREPVAIIDDLAADDAMRESREIAARNDSAGKYIRTSEPVIQTPPPVQPRKKSSDSLAIPIVLGLTLIGAALAALLSGADARLGEWGPLLAFAALLIGGLMFLVALLYALRGAGPDDN